jgi:hypothetical protein
MQEEFPFMPRRRGWVLLLLAVALLGAAPLARAAIKLYLKDGSYQIVKSYQVEGDRVRYYSLERSAWEEVPLSMVDFAATRRSEAAEKAQQQKQLEQAHELEQEHFERTSPQGFEIAPHLHLPGDEGVFAFDGTRVIRLVQSPAKIVRDKKRFALALALPAPLLKNRDLAVLEGPRAAISISGLQPTFYAQFADGAGAHLQLIPVRATQHERVLEKIQSGIGVGKSGEEREALPLERVQVKPGIYRLRPLQPLPPGQYALGELLEKTLNLDVWDFGIVSSPPTEPAGGDAPPVIRRNPPPPGK